MVVIFIKKSKMVAKVFTVSASIRRKPQLCQILTSLGLLYRPPFTDKGNIWCAKADQTSNFIWVCLFCRLPVAKNRNFWQILTFGASRSIYSSALWRRKTPFLSFFGLRHLVMPTAGGNLRKLNTGAQLQTFPYPTASKSFLFSNVFMAKLGEQTLTFISVTDRQSVTDKKAWQTDKKLNVFSPTRRRVKSEPYQTWYGDTGPRARSCTSKRLVVWRIVSPLGALKIWG